MHACPEAFARECGRSGLGKDKWAALGYVPDDEHGVIVGKYQIDGEVVQAAVAGTGGGLAAKGELE